MSSILKALEKVEESQNTRRSGGGSVFVPSRKRRPAWVIPAGILGGAVVASLVTFAAMGGLSRPAPPVASLQTAPLQAVVAEPAPQPEQTLYRQPEVVAVPAKVVAVPAKVVAVPAKVAAVPAKVAAVPAKATAVPAKNSPAAVRRQLAKARPKPAQPLRAIPVVGPALSLPSAAQMAAARVKQVFPIPVIRAQAIQATAQKSRQDIRVTGIAWQKDGASSAAIVNGRTLKEGGTVDGYKVEQIFENHVTFSGSNGKLKVPLGGGE